MIDYKTVIRINPNKRFGKPCIRETRITVYDVLGWLANGMSNKEIILDFPELIDEDIRACLAFAADKEQKLLRTKLNNISNERKKTLNSLVLWADFNASSDLGLRLNCKGTIADLTEQNVALEEGMKLILWDEDFDALNQQDNLIIKATARFNKKEDLWEAEFDWIKIKNESEI